MELYVNDALVDVSLAEGDTVDTLLRAVEKELGERIIATMLLDGAYSACDDPAVLKRPLSGIQKVELIAASREEIGIALMGDAQNILKAAAEELGSGAVLHKKELLEGLAWILESLDALSQSLPFPPADLAIMHGAIADIIRILGEELGAQEACDVARVLNNFAGHFDALKQKLSKPETPDKESLYARLAQVKESLPDLASDFQTGKDVEALSLLGGVIDAIELFMRYAAQNPSEENRLFAEELNGLSSSLLEAFENKDYALIADLIEFDLSEKLEAILEAGQEN